MARILLVAPQPFYEPRGTPMNVREMCRVLCGAGHEVELATYPIGAPVSIPGLRIRRALCIPGIRQVPIGFSLRKLGRIDEAMGYYHKVLAAHPDRTTTRQYLGEAFLQKGEPAKAKEQLAEIAKRCGVACEDYQLLADEIAKFERKSG